jgi:hypothetical protein
MLAVPRKLHNLLLMLPSPTSRRLQSAAKSHLENVKQSAQAAVESVLPGNENAKAKVQSSMAVEGPDILAEDHRVEG